MFSIVNIDSMDLIDDELETLDMARDMALEYATDVFSPFMVLDEDNHPMGMAYEGVWYVNSETLTDGG